MKRKLMAAAVLLTIAIGMPAAVFAQTTSQHEVTRAQVIADLVQAQRDGTVPAPNWDYPPSRQTIERNRELYALGHGEQGVTVSHASASAPTSSGQ
ncbi:DUF4148 domain-containing protein [Burkholderia sp. PU8-34]